MEVTRLSNTGQVIIPKALRDAHRWEAGHLNLTSIQEKQQLSLS